MRYGTCHFVTKADAVRYYTDPEVVERKLKDGEIKIGKPPLKEGEKLKINGREGRYFIEVAGG